MCYAGYADVHSFAVRHRDTYSRIGNADLNRAPTPTYCKRHAAPGWRQARIQADRFTGKFETGEAEYHCLPYSTQPGDPYAAGAVRVEF